MYFPWNPSMLHETQWNKTLGSQPSGAAEVLMAQLCLCCVIFCTHVSTVCWWPFDGTCVSLEMNPLRVFSTSSIWSCRVTDISVVMSFAHYITGVRHCPQPWVTDCLVLYLHVSLCHPLVDLSFCGLFIFNEAHPLATVTDILILLKWTCICTTPVPTNVSCPSTLHHTSFSLPYNCTMSGISD